MSGWSTRNGRSGPTIARAASGAAARSKSQPSRTSPVVWWSRTTATFVTPSRARRSAVSGSTEMDPSCPSTSNTTSATRSHPFDPLPTAGHGGPYGQDQRWFIGEFT